MNKLLNKVVVSVGVACVVAAAGFVGAGAPADAVQVQNVSAGAKNYANDAANVRVNLDKVEVDKSVKELNVYMTNTQGKQLYAFDKASEIEDESYPIWSKGKKGTEFSTGYTTWAKGEYAKTDKVKVKFVVNGKTFNKNISLLGKTFKKVKESGTTYYSYGEGWTWNVTSKGVTVTK